MQWLLEKLEECSFAQDHVFYIDGFPDFTRQNFEIVEHLIRESSSVTIALCCDEPSSSKLAFEKVGETADELLKLAQKCQVDVNIVNITERDNPVHKIAGSLFQGPIPEEDLPLQLFKADSIYQECVTVANRIQELVRNGARYRDIGVVCTNTTAYRGILNNVFLRSGIPMYLSGTDDVLEKPIITTVLSAIDTVMGNYDQKDVIRYLKTPFAPVDESLSDQIEAYAIQWGISGNQWTKEWTYHPFRLGGDWDEHAVNTLRQLNIGREMIIAPLSKMRESLLSAKNIAELVCAVYGFFDEIQLAEKLSQIAESLYDTDNRSAQILDQVWEILVCALEQLYDTVGQYSWNADVFSRLFKLLLGQYTVGTIPATIDTVAVGNVSAMRCQETKHLFVMGAVEGSFPTYGGTKGVLTDVERTELRVLGLPLTGGAADGLQIEFSEIYGSFCGASHSVTVSYPSGQPSFIYQRLRKMVKDEAVIDSQFNGCWSSRLETAAYLLRVNREDVADKIGLKEEIRAISDKRNHKLGLLSAEGVKKLYGKKLYLSASRIDVYASCRFAYFLEYGLRLKERKAITIDPSEFGNYVHAVLENTVNEVMENCGFAKVTLDEALQIANKHAEAYASAHFSEIDAERVNYLFKRNSDELQVVVAELWEELKDSQFAPKYTELGFNRDEAMPQIVIEGADIPAFLTGYVDRVDTWKHGNETYFRVVDYKTGRKNFDYCDILVGKGLQMLLYLYTLMDHGQHLIGENPVPAGVQYFPARMPFSSVKEPHNDKKVTSAKNKELERKGLVLANEAVIKAMEPSEPPIRVSYSRTKENALTGNVASLQDFKELKEYIFGLLRKFVNEIAAGEILPNPYYRDRYNDSCKYCSFSKICHRDDIEDVRQFKAVSAQDFWSCIRKEDQHG